MAKRKKNLKDKDSIKELKAEMKKLQGQVEDNNNKYLRLLAEFDNYKKRIIQDRKDKSKYEGTEIFKKIIPIIDDIDRVINNELINDSSIIDGINLIKDKFILVLNDFGIKSYDSINKKFDPDFHEAMMTKKTKKKSNIIIEEYEKGYMQYDRVIRYAKVVVSE